MGKYIYRQLLLTILIFDCFSASAQKPHGRNYIQLSLTPRLYFNKSYIDNNNISPDPISTKNSACYSIGIEYERITRGNLIIDAGVEYGITKHKISLVQDFSNFDPEAQKLSGYVYTRNLDLKFHYISPRLLVGYKLNINKNWSVVGKLGLSVSLFLDGYNAPSQPYNISYQRDNGVEVEAAFMAETISLGDSKNQGGSRFFSFPLHTYDCYIGIERMLTYGWIKKLSVGLEGTRAINWKNPPGILQVNSYADIYQTTNNIDSYRDRNYSLGLRIGLGLWK